MIKKYLKRIFSSLFDKELKEMKDVLSSIKYSEKTLNKTIDSCKLYEKKLVNVLENIDVSVDVHEHHYSPSWAVVSLQGNKSDYIKFIDLGNVDIQAISSFLRRFERNGNIKVDATPPTTKFLKIIKK